MNFDSKANPAGNFDGIKDSMLLHVSLFWTLFGYNLEATLGLYGPELESELKSFGDFTHQSPPGDILYIRRN